MDGVGLTSFVSRGLSHVVSLSPSLGNGREALRVFVEHLHVQDMRRQQLESKIDDGLASLKAGKGIPMERVKENMRRRKEEFLKKRTTKAA